MAFINPQAPLKNLKTGDYFYPLTNLNQIICTSNRLSVFMNESSNNNLTLNNIDRINGKVQITGSDSSSFLGALAEEELDKTDIRAWCDIATNIHKSSCQGDMILKRFFSRDEAATTYNLPCVDSHMMIFSIDGIYTNWTRILALDMRSPTLFIGGKNHENWQTWTQLITDNTAQTITAQKTFTQLILGTSNQARFLENRGGSTVSINDGVWNHGQTGVAGSTNRATVWHQRWLQSGLTYTPSGGSATTLTDCGDMVIWLSSSPTANTLQTNIAIDGLMFALDGFKTNQWYRSIGNVGWYSQTYGGGWYMSDTTWIRSYNNKGVYTGGGKIRTDGEMWSKYIRIVDNWIGVYENIDNTTKRFGYMQIDRSNNGWFRFAKEQGGGFLFTGGSVRCDSGFRVEGNNQGLYVKSTGFPTSTPSATTYFEPLNMYDSGNNRIGTVGCGWETSGRRFTHIQCQRLIGTTTHYTQIFMRIDGSGNRRVDASAPIYGAVWNDYAEFRKGKMDNLKPGQVVTEIGNGKMKLANKKLQKGCKILSDTFGFAIGETKECKLPIAVSGRVLVYCDTPKEELEPGDCLCANYNGNAIKMTQEEIINYPDRIIGTVSEIPSYEIWHGGEYRPEIKNNPEDIQVDGRIWVYVR